MVQQPLLVPAPLQAANNAPLALESLCEFYKVAWDHWMEQAVQVQWTVFQTDTCGSHNDAEFITTGINFYLQIVEYKRISLIKMKVSEWCLTGISIE